MLGSTKTTKPDNHPLTTFISTSNLEREKQFLYWQDAICGLLHHDCQTPLNNSFIADISATHINGIRFSHVHSQSINYQRTPFGVRHGREEAVFIAFQKNGNSLLAQDGREVELSRGDFSCLDSTRPYSMTYSDNNEIFSLYVPRHMLINRLGPSERFTARLISGKTPTGSIVSNFVHQVTLAICMLDHTLASQYVDITLDLITSALSELICSQHQGSKKVLLLFRAKQLINEQLGNSELNPDMIAKYLGISKRYLHALFKETNMTVNSFLWQQRLKKCRKDLSSPILAGLTVSEIAMNCGFRNPAHFTTRFKNEYALTPSNFRKNNHIHATLTT